MWGLDCLTVGLIARTFPLDKVREVLAETGRASRRQRDLDPRALTGAHRFKAPDLRTRRARPLSPTFKRKAVWMRAVVPYKSPLTRILSDRARP